MTQTQSDLELDIMAAALPIVLSVPRAQDTCWPGDGPAHDDECTLGDHAASAAAVAATEGLFWDFSCWSDAARWMHRTLDAQEYVRHARAD